MITYAALPSWILVIIVLSAMGPMMRMIFGERERPRRERLKGRDARLVSADVDRLETAIAERDTVIDDLQQRLSEMESRLDFAERMLARPQEGTANKAPV